MRVTTVNLLLCGSIFLCGLAFGVYICKPNKSNKDSSQFKFDSLVKLIKTSNIEYSELIIPENIDYHEGIKGIEASCVNDYLIMNKEVNNGVTVVTFKCM